MFIDEVRLPLYLPMIIPSEPVLRLSGACILHSLAVYFSWKLQKSFLKLIRNCLELCSFFFCRYWPQERKQSLNLYLSCFISKAWIRCRIDQTQQLHPKSEMKYQKFLISLTKLWLTLPSKEDKMDLPFTSGITISHLQNAIISVALLLKV